MKAKNVNKKRKALKNKIVAKITQKSNDFELDFGMFDFEQTKPVSAKKIDDKATDVRFLTAKARANFFAKAV